MRQLFFLAGMLWVFNAWATSDLLLQLETSLGQDGNAHQIWSDSPEFSQVKNSSFHEQALQLKWSTPLLSEQTLLVLTANLAEHHASLNAADYTHRGLKIQLPWVFTSVWDGVFGWQDEKLPNPFYNSLQGMDQTHAQTAQMAVRLKINPEWSVPWLYERQVSEADDRVLHGFQDYERHKHEAALRYDAQAGHRFQLGYAKEETLYTHRTPLEVQTGGQSYDYSGPWLQWEWQVGAKTQLNTRLMHLAFKDRPDASMQGFAKTKVDVSAQWQPSPAWLWGSSWVYEPQRLLTSNALGAQVAAWNQRVSWQYSPKLKLVWQGTWQRQQAVLPTASGGGGGLGMTEKLFKNTLGLEYEVQKSYIAFVQSAWQHQTRENAHLRQNLWWVGLRYRWENRTGAMERLNSY